MQQADPSDSPPKFFSQVLFDAEVPQGISATARDTGTLALNGESSRCADYSGAIVLGLTYMMDPQLVKKTKKNYSPWSPDIARLIVLTTGVRTINLSKSFFIVLLCGGVSLASR
jgi:hypothetical protein